MVHDEEAEISIRLATLIANSQRSHPATDQLPNSDAAANANGELAQGQHASPQAADAGESLFLCYACYSALASRNTVERLPLQPAVLSKLTTSQVLPALLSSDIALLNDYSSDGSFPTGASWNPLLGSNFAPSPPPQICHTVQLQCLVRSQQCCISESCNAVPAGLTVGMQGAPPDIEHRPGSTSMDEPTPEALHHPGDPSDPPLEPVWSPQYSPSKLASLIPESHPPVTTLHSNAHAHDQSSQDLYPRGSLHPSRPAYPKPEAHHASHSGHAHLSDDHTDTDQQHGKARSRSADQHHRQVTGFMSRSSVLPSSGVSTALLPRHQSPAAPLPPPGPAQGLDPVAPYHHSMLPAHSAGHSSTMPASGHHSLLQGQHHPQSLPGEHPGMHSSSVGLERPGTDASMGIAAAPGPFQSEQHAQMAHTERVLQPGGLAPLEQYPDAHDHRPAGPVQSLPEHRHGHQLYSEQGGLHNSQVPGTFQGSLRHPVGMQPVGNMNQFASLQTEARHQADQHESASQALRRLEAQPQSMQGRPLLDHSAQFSAVHHSQHGFHFAKADHVIPIKPDPGASAPGSGMLGGPNPAGLAEVSHGHSAGHYRAPDGMLSGAQSATILSAELSAALAAGVLGQSTEVQHGMGHNQQMLQRTPMESAHLASAPHLDAAPAAALPPELSAALASGQLGLHLGAAAAAPEASQQQLHTHAAYVTQGHMPGQQQIQDQKLLRHPHAQPQYHEPPEQSVQHGMPTRHSSQAGRARVEPLPETLIHPSLHTHAAVLQPEWPSEPYAAHQLVRHTHEPFQVSGPQLQLNAQHANMPEQHQPHSDDNHLPQYHHQQPHLAQHLLHVRQHDDVHMHSQAPHPHAQHVLHEGEQRPHNPHMSGPGPGPPHHTHMRPAHPQQFPGGTQLPYAEPARQDRPWHDVQQPAARPDTWADDRQRVDVGFGPPHQMTGAPEGMCCTHDFQQFTKLHACDFQQFTKLHACAKLVYAQWVGFSHCTHYTV